MALAVTSLGSMGDTNSRSAYTCSVNTADASTLVLVGVAVSTPGGTVAQPTGVVGGGMMFSLVTSSVSFNDIATPVHNLSVWRSMSVSPTNSRVTASFDASMSGCAIVVHQVSGVSTSGTSGANAIGKSATSVVDSENNLVLIAPSATSTANGWIAFHSANSQEVASSGNGYQDVDEAIYLTPDSHLASAWTTLSTGTRVTWSASGADSRGGVIVELVADNPAPTSSLSTSVGVPRRPPRIPPVPSSITGAIAHYLQLVARQLNSEVYISMFSGTSPNTSGVTGIPGNLVMNVGSASTNTRLWVMGGSTMSATTTGWVPLRTA